MSRIAAIVAMAENRVIGRDNDLPWHLPEDLKRFKKITTGKPVIMGRKTFQSIVDRLGKPLPGRTSIVLSRGSFKHEGALVVPTIAEALTKATELADKDGAEEVMIIGGAQIFREALPLTERIYLSLIHKDIEGDAWFPELDPDDWKEQEKETFPAYDDKPSWSFITLDRC